MTRDNQVNPISMSELLPCPFCGSPANVTPDDSYDQCIVGCSGICEVDPAVVMHKSTLEKAIEIWNGRKPSGLGARMFGYGNGMMGAVKRVKAMRDEHPDSAFAICANKIIKDLESLAFSGETK